MPTPLAHIEDLEKRGDERPVRRDHQPILGEARRRD
jgi:hypothetical protein